MALVAYGTIAERAFNGGYRLDQIRENGFHTRSLEALILSMTAAGTIKRVPSHIPSAGDKAPLLTILSPTIVTI